LMKKPEGEESKTNAAPCLIAITSTESAEWTWNMDRGEIAKAQVSSSSSDRSLRIIRSL
ncbi:hypothetical protein AVEN_73348-1, partial [Araneus ventricosus]